MQKPIKEFTTKKEADLYMDCLNRHHVDFLLNFESDNCEDYPFEDIEKHVTKWIVEVI